MKFFLTILPTVMLALYGQLVTKWRVTELMSLQQDKPAMIARLLVYITDPYIISAYVFSFLSSVAWLYVVEKFPVSVAFPAYVGTLFVAVLLGSSVFLREPVSWSHVAGVAFIMTGVYIVSRA